MRYNIRTTPMLPCCGHFLITESEKETLIGMDAYREVVYAFADNIVAYYKASAPRKLPADEFILNGYTAFWNEWRRRGA